MMIAGATMLNAEANSIVAVLCPDGEIGRRSGLKIRRPQGCGGSSPPPGTNKIKDLDEIMPRQYSIRGYESPIFEFRGRLSADF
jgi:hypothetical protein